MDNVIMGIAIARLRQAKVSFDSLMEGLAAAVVSEPYDPNTIYIGKALAESFPETGGRNLDEDTFMYLLPLAWTLNQQVGWILGEFGLTRTLLSEGDEQEARRHFLSGARGLYTLSHKCPDLWDSLLAESYRREREKFKPEPFFLW